MADKLPWLKFYTADWLANSNLRRSSLSAKGMWIDLLCMMHESEERGALISQGKPWTDQQIAAAIGGDTSATLSVLRELLENRVAKRDSRNAICSSRMLRDERKRSKCSQAGKLGGGNPSLTFKGKSKRPSKGGAKGTSDIWPLDSSSGVLKFGESAERDQPKGGAVRAADPIWDTVCELWGMNPKVHATRIGKIVRDLKALEAKPDDIRTRRDRYQHQWPTAADTPEALVKHWGTFATEQTRPADTQNIARISAAAGKYSGLGLTVGRKPDGAPTMAQGGGPCAQSD